MRKNQPQKPACDMCDIYQSQIVASKSHESENYR